jgi:hypothetical protein
VRSTSCRAPPCPSSRSRAPLCRRDGIRGVCSMVTSKQLCYGGCDKDMKRASVTGFFVQTSIIHLNEKTGCVILSSW